jgi:hypothetical protein
MKNTVHVLKKKIRMEVENLNTLMKRLDGISHKKTTGSEYKTFRDRIHELKMVKESLMSRLNAALHPTKEPSERLLSRLYESLTRVEGDCRGTLQRYIR